MRFRIALLFVLSLTVPAGLSSLMVQPVAADTPELALTWSDQTIHGALASGNAINLAMNGGRSVVLYWDDDPPHQTYGAVTTNNGASWSNTSYNATALQWGQMEHVSGNIFHGVFGDGGGVNPRTNYWRSTDGGVTWAVTSPGIEERSQNAMVAKGDSTTVLFIGNDDPENRAEVFTSTDNGNTWSGPTTLAGNAWEPKPQRPSRLHYNAAAGMFYSCYANDQGELVFVNSTDSGATWSKTTVAAAAFGGCEASSDGQTLVAVYHPTGSGPAKAARSTDGGASWSTQTINASHNPFHVDVRRLNDTVWFASYQDLTNDEVVAAYTADAGLTWQFSVASESGDDGVQGYMRMDFDSVSGRAGIAYRSTDDSWRYTSASVPEFEPEACVLPEDCEGTVLDQYGLREVRTTYDFAPTVVVRERGAPTYRQDGGNVFAYDEDFNLLETANPCQTGTYGSGTWEFSYDSKDPGLVTTTDGYVLVGCGQTSLTDTSSTRFKSLVPSTLAIDRTDGQLFPGMSYGRMEASTRNLMAFASPQDWAVAYDFAQSRTQEVVRLSGLGRVGVDEANDRWAAIHNTQTRVYDFTEGAIGSGLIVQVQVSGNAVDLSGDFIFIGNSAGVTRYSWNSTGFSQTHTTASYTVPDKLGPSGLRLSKDGDFLAVWNGADVSVLYASNLTLVDSNSPDWSGEGGIWGCDFDLLNNWLFCVTDETLHRMAIFDSVPTAWGENKAGTEPDNSTLLNGTNPATGDTDFGNRPPIDPFPSGGGEANTLFGIDLASFGDGTGMGLVAGRWFLAVLITAAMAAVFWGVGQRPFMAGIGTLMGIGLSTALGLLDVWVIFILGVAVIGVVVHRARATGGG